MAGNKVNKAKGKYDKSKGTSIIPSHEETEDYDFSLLRKPIQTSITGLGQARKIFDLATEELKKLLSDECDVLYECKVCRNMFRSLANFISHKRVYCKETFDVKEHGHFVNPMPIQLELKKIQATEKGFKESLKKNTIDGGNDDDERIPLTKDLTSIVEKLAKCKSNYMDPKEFKVALQEIPSTSVAVFQNIENGSEETENMLNQVCELDKIMSKDMGVMQRDGNFKVESSADMDNVIQISDDEENGDNLDLKCKICDMQFSTQKTLKFHMKYKHVESRLVYPCPDCLEIFSTSWSVYRHLFKVHRKSAAQIRRLRESIQAKAFKMNNPPAFYERRKNNQKTPAVPKITEEERIEQENQAWMDNMEFDGEISRCGGCGRTFERRAALAAHTHTCQRSRALVRRPDAKRIEIQIRKDYNKGPNANLALLKPADTIETCKVKDEPMETEKETEDTDKESITKISKTVDDNIKNIDETSMDSASQSDTEKDSVTSESPEKIEPKTEIEISIPNTFPANVSQPPAARLPFARQAENSNLIAMRQRIFRDIELGKLLCKICNTSFDYIRELYDHVAVHFKWMRYACKLCNFKHYHFDQLPEHVKTVHKLKGDKDFYISTVKALDGAEALELSEDPVESSGPIETESESPEQLSRCSSDSSRLSDDSSSSSAKIDLSRKRRLQQNNRYGKRKRESLVKVNKEDALDRDENDSPSNPKNFEENSSDIEDVCDKVEKRPAAAAISSVASRRPVRRKAKPKHADFEYDLSNLLKMEAQGYRENQTSATTSNKKDQTKKKPADIIISYDMINKECLGAMDTLSRKAVDNANAATKSSFPVYTQRERPVPNVFARPMVPKTITKIDKNSPKKDASDEKKDSSSSNKETKNKSLIDDPPKDEKDDSSIKTSLDNTASTSKEVIKVIASDKAIVSTDHSTDARKSLEVYKNKTITSVVPIKFRRQSLDVMKNPIINKNIKDFTKAGMKTKILVIKPIKVKDGAQSVNSPMKFQTIKLKDPNRKSTGKDISSDQVMVVKVPNVVDGNVVLSVPDNVVLAAPETAELSTIQTQNPEVPVTNGDKESSNPSLSMDIETTPTEQSIEENNQQSSEINLLCDEDIKKIDVTNNTTIKPIVLKLDNQVASSNGVS